MATLYRASNLTPSRGTIRGPPWRPCEDYSPQALLLDGPTKGRRCSVLSLSAGNGTNGTVGITAMDQEMTEDEVSIVVQSVLRKAQRAMNSCSPQYNRRRWRFGDGQLKMVDSCQAALFTIRGGGSVDVSLGNNHALYLMVTTLF